MKPAVHAHLLPALPGGLFKYERDRERERKKTTAKETKTKTETEKRKRNSASFSFSFSFFQGSQNAKSTTITNSESVECLEGVRVRGGRESEEVLPVVLIHSQAKEVPNGKNWPTHTQSEAGKRAKQAVEENKRCCL